MPRRWPLLLPSLVLSATLIACTRQESAIPPAEMAPTPVKYACAAGQTLTALYSGDSASLTFPDGRLLTLPHVVSGSGARYSNDSITWWSKGDSGFVMAGDTVTIKDCGATQ